jgi:hypothetical protein
LSIQSIQNKFINTFGANITNITKVDWDEIELIINKLVVENNDTLWMEIFPNHENHFYFFLKHKICIICYQTKSPWCGKNDILKISCESKNK